MRRGDVVPMVPPGRRRGGPAQSDQLVVVVQADDRLPAPLVLVAPLGESARAVSAGPEVTVSGRPSRVLVELMVSLDANRLGPAVDHLSPETMAALDDALRAILGLG